MKHVLVFGAGKIGTLIAFLLARSGDYHVHLADISVDTPAIKRLMKTPQLEFVQLDAQDTGAIAKFLRKNTMQAIASCLPYYRNIPLMEIAKEFNVHYFDLTEDTFTASKAMELSNHATQAFVPQCGLAPGFISIVANDIMQHFSELDTVKMRVGALPVNISNALQYSLTWSTDGLINEYGNMCQGIADGQEIKFLPLDDLEEIKIDGLTYEAFNTSGGIGTLADTYRGRVQQLNYKTIRYPGHCNKMKFLMNDLKLNDDRETLKRILENTLPKTSQDVVLVYVAVTGLYDGQLVEESYVKKFYPKVIDGMRWSAIQLTTASSLCAVLDMVTLDTEKYHGLVRQEQFSLNHLITNRFGQYYA